jgi:hypothetical protein
MQDFKLVKTQKCIKFDTKKKNMASLISPFLYPHPITLGPSCDIYLLRPTNIFAPQNQALPSIIHIKPLN